MVSSISSWLMVTILSLCRCEHGILANCYPSCELKSHHPDYKAKLPTIPVRKAARTQRGGTKCNCSSTCRSGRCSCRLARLECSSHCHQKNSTCLTRKMLSLMSVLSPKWSTQMKFLLCPSRDRNLTEISRAHKV